MEHIKAVLLDIDGTYFSSEEIIPHTYLQEFQRFHAETGKPSEFPDYEKVMDQIGKPIKEIFENLGPDLTDEERQELSENILWKLVEQINEGGGQYYDGAIDTVKELHNRGYKLFGASNGRFPYIEAILKYSGVFDLFTEIPVVNNTTIHNKTELVSYILKEHGLSPDEALMVGDRTSDRDAGINNHAYFAACRFGHGSLEEWEGAHLYLDSLPELLEHLPALPG